MAKSKKVEAKKKNSSSELIVKAIDVSKIYHESKPNEVRALDNANLEINRGEVMAIMGPSGSGKTTLLNCISGIDAATSGQIYIDGADLQKMRDRQKTKYRAEKMGFIFQSFNLIPVLNAVENVEMPLLVTGMKGSEARKRAMEMLDVVGLADRAKHKPNELSGGQQQRVTVARALVHRPAVIWADEPTGNLDRKTAFAVFDLIKKLNKEFDMTFVVVTHDDEIAAMTERTVELASGKIVSGR